MRTLPRPSHWQHKTVRAQRRPCQHAPDSRQQRAYTNPQPRAHPSKPLQRVGRSAHRLSRAFLSHATVFGPRTSRVAEWWPDMAFSSGALCNFTTTLPRQSARSLLFFVAAPNGSRRATNDEFARATAHPRHTRHATNAPRGYQDCASGRGRATSSECGGALARLLARALDHGGGAGLRVVRARVSRGRAAVLFSDNGALHTQTRQRRTRRTARSNGWTCKSRV